jgi:hypothetical protein
MSVHLRDVSTKAQAQAQAQVQAQVQVQVQYRVMDAMDVIDENYRAEQIRISSGRSDCSLDV